MDFKACKMPLQKPHSVLHGNCVSCPRFGAATACFVSNSTVNVLYALAPGTK